eukprot:3982431-Pyramimonas_sp.AAC.1
MLSKIADIASDYNVNVIVYRIILKNFPTNFSEDGQDGATGKSVNRIGWKGPEGQKEKGQDKWEIVRKCKSDNKR